MTDSHESPEEQIARLEALNASMQIHLKNYMDIAAMLGDENRDLRKSLREALAIAHND